MKNKKHAYDFVTNKVNYKRPLFHFPDLSSELGNPYSFWPLLHSKLNELGFRKEAKNFEDRMGFTKYSFEEIIQLASYFLDFNPQNELSNKNNIVKEDSEFVYVKIKKELYHSDTNIKQPSLFKIRDIETFKEMIEDEDFSIKNCYGRTFLHYIDKPELLNYFLSLNEEKKWIDLIDLDNFNSSYLHSAPNLECFQILFTKMAEIEPITTETFLFGKDLFNKSGYENFTTLLSLKVQNKEDFISTFNSPEILNTVSKVLRALKKVSPSECDFFESQFSTNKSIASYLKENKELEQNINKMFLMVKLDNNLSHKETNADKIKKLKI